MIVQTLICDWKYQPDPTKGDAEKMKVTVHFLTADASKIGSEDVELVRGPVPGMLQRANETAAKVQTKAQKMRKMKTDSDRVADEFAMAKHLLS